MRAVRVLGRPGPASWGALCLRARRQACRASAGVSEVAGCDPGWRHARPFPGASRPGTARATWPGRPGTGAAAEGGGRPTSGGGAAHPAPVPGRAACPPSGPTNAGEGPRRRESAETRVTCPGLPRAPRAPATGSFLSQRRYGEGWKKFPNLLGERRWLGAELCLVRTAAGPA